MRELVEFLCMCLVEDPDAVEVEEREAEGRVVLEVSVAPGDIGRVIGRGGRIAAALRQVARASATVEGARVTVEIVE